jgi:hypothetical protein
LEKLIKACSDANEELSLIALVSIGGRDGIAGGLNGAMEKAAGDCCCFQESDLLEKLN